jgi:hypothetical protein
MFISELQLLRSSHLMSRRRTLWAFADTIRQVFCQGFVRARRMGAEASLRNRELLQQQFVIRSR